MSSCLNIRFPHLLVPAAVKECHTFFVLHASSTCCTNAVPLDITSWTRSYHCKIIVNCVIYAAIDLTFIKRWCQRDVSEENGSMLQLGDWILIFPLCFLLIMNFLRGFTFRALAHVESEHSSTGQSSKIVHVFFTAWTGVYKGAWWWFTSKILL